MSADVFQLEGAAEHRNQPIHLAHEQPFSLGDLHIIPPMRQVIAKDGAAQTIEPRVMQVLVALHRADGGIVSRDDLIHSCWRGTIVGEDSINRTIALIRRLAEGIGREGFRVETIPRVGYRLILAESATEASEPPAAPASSKRPLIVACAAMLAVLAGAVALWRTVPQGPAYSLSVQAFRAPDGSAGFEDMLSAALTSRDIPTTGGQAPLALTGSIERGTNVARFTVRLVSTTDQQLVWSTSLQQPAPAVAGMLSAMAQCTLSFANDEGHRLAPDILSRFARGCELMIRGNTERGLTVARQLTEHAPDFAGGWFLRSNQALGLYFRQPAGTQALRQEAQTAAEKLVALRPSAQEGQASLALAMTPDRPVEREQLLRRAITLQPIFYDVAQAYLGDFLLQTGRFEEAFRLYRANAQKEPNLMARQAQLFFASAATGRWPIADEALARIRQIDATPMPALLWRNAVWRGDWAQAQAKVPLELPAQEQAGIATYRAMASGDPVRKQAAVQLVLALPADCCVPLRIEMLTLLGHTEEAIALLDGFEAGRTPGRLPGNIGLFLWDPALRPLWFDPRIEPFLQRNGWIAYWRASRSKPDLCTEAKAPSFCRLLKN